MFIEKADPKAQSDWLLAQGSRYHFFGTTWAGCAIGGGRSISPLCQMYQSNPDFRTVIQTKVRDGSMTESNAKALISIPLRARHTPLQAEADALLEGFFKRSSP